MPVLDAYGSVASVISSGDLLGRRIRPDTTDARA